MSPRLFRTVFFTYLILGPWAHVGSFGPSLGSFSYFSLIWTQFGLILGKSAWFSDLGPNLGSLWAHYGLIMGSFLEFSWAHNEPTANSARGLILGSFFEPTVRPLWVQNEPVGSFGLMVGSSWAHCAISTFCLENLKAEIKIVLR